MHGTIPISEEQALAAMRARAPARVSIPTLAREWGWTRDKVRTRLRRWRRSGDLPSTAKQRQKSANAVALAPLVVAPTAAPAAPTIDPPAPAPTVDAPAPVVAIDPPAQHRARAHGLTRRSGATVLAFVGIALAGIGMIETTAYAASVGGLLFAALAVCADALVLFMPAAIAALWRRRSAAAFLAAALWLVGGAVTLANLSGYVGGSDDRFRAGRETQSLERTLAFERLARLRHERDAIAETRPAAALRIALNHVRRSKSAALGEALAVAQRRDAVDAELTALGADLTSVAPLATVDPSASVLSELTGATVTEAALRRLRLGLLLLLPLCGGLVLSVALSLVVRRDAPA
jgi:hypothetical protein